MPGIVAAGALAQTCYKLITIGTACGLNDCEGSSECGQPQIMENETVTTTGSKGTRVDRSQKDFLCWKTWLEKDQNGVCTLLRDCSSTVGGWVLSGDACVWNPPV